MKREEIDEHIASLLKNGMAQPTESQRFTANVLDRLPKSHGNFWLLGSMFYVLALAVCAGCWALFFKDFSLNVITVRDLLGLMVLPMMTIFAVFACLWQALSASEYKTCVF